MPGQTHRIPETTFQYTFGPADPVARVRSGDTVVAATRDSRGNDPDGQPMPEHLKPHRGDTELLERNPVVGPVYVEGAEPGDALAVEIVRIRINRPWGFSALSPNFGSFTREGWDRRMLINEPLSRMLYRYTFDLEADTATIALEKSRQKSVTFPLNPFIGSIGVAPRFGRVETTLAPGEFGGNMDCVETRERTTVTFPVWVRGAYLSFGDVHAAQGDGEICGTAIETTAEVTLRLAVRKGWSIEWPRMEDAAHIMVAASARPLYDAFAIAHVELCDWLVRDYGFDRYEAFQVLSQVGTARVGNVVDPFYTVVAKFPKACLDGGA